VDHYIQRLSQGRSPLEDFLPPQHPEIIVKPSLSPKLSLCGIPDGIMGIGVLELIKAVQVRSRIVPVPVQGLLGPSRKGLVTIIGVQVSAHVVPELAPCDKLVQKSFGIPTHAPPAFTLPSPTRPNPVLGPSFMIYKVLKNPVD
jgi:hypothetical protein